MRSRSFVFSLAAVVAVASLSLACSAPADDESVDGTESDLSGIPKEGSADAIALLGYLNDPTVDAAALVAAGATKNTAAKLIAHRQGADKVDGTGDDDAFDTVAEVDAVPGVGPTTINLLLMAARAHAGLPPATDYVASGPCDFGGHGSLGFSVYQGNDEAVLAFTLSSAQEADITMGFDDSGKAHTSFTSFDEWDYTFDATLVNGLITITYNSTNQNTHQTSAPALMGGCTFTAQTMLAITPGKGLNRAPDLVLPPVRIASRSNSSCMVDQGDGVLVMGDCVDAPQFSVAVGGRAAVQPAGGGDIACFTARSVRYTSSVVSRAAAGDCRNSLRPYDGTFVLSSGGQCLGRTAPNHFGYLVSCDDSNKRSWWQLRPNGILFDRANKAVLNYDATRKALGEIASFYGTEPPGSTVSRWDLVPGGAIRERASGLCLGAPATANGVLSLVACDAPTHLSWQLEVELGYIGPTVASSFYLESSQQNAAVPFFQPSTKKALLETNWHLVF